MIFKCNWRTLVSVFWSIVNDNKSKENPLFLIVLLLAVFFVLDKQTSFYWEVLISKQHFLQFWMHFIIFNEYELIFITCTTKSTECINYLLFVYDDPIQIHLKVSLLYNCLCPSVCMYVCLYVCPSSLGGRRFLGP